VKAAAAKVAVTVAVVAKVAVPKLQSLSPSGAQYLTRSSNPHW